MRRFFVLLAFVVGACATTSLPRDVQRFVERRDACDHLRGEERDATKAGAREFLDGLEKYCAGTDLELARLRGRFYQDRAVIERLSRYETRIERKPE